MTSGIGGVQEIREHLQELTGLEVIELVNSGASEDDIVEAIRLLVRIFPHRTYVAGEYADLWVGAFLNPRRIAHVWLFRLDGRAVGFSSFETNLDRQVVVQNYVGMDREAIDKLPLRWVVYLVQAVQQTGIADCAAAGTTLLASMGENQHSHQRAWERMGYITLDLDYYEPYHGKHWLAEGEPTFFESMAQVWLTDAGRERDFPEIADRALRAFLIDQYCLPEDNPTVVAMLEAASRLPADAGRASSSSA